MSDVYLNKGPLLEHFLGNRSHRVRRDRLLAFNIVFITIETIESIYAYSNCQL